MAPAEKVNLPLRWEFLPVRNADDSSIHWQWRAYTQAGEVAMQSDGPFETLTECMKDARSRGYGGH